MNIDNLMIEVTRRCNNECDHCLRGEAQDQDLPDDILVNLLSRHDIEYISQVTFTGGEPTLNIKSMWRFLELCKAHNIRLGHFYIAVNGKIVPDDFIRVCMELYMYSEEKEMCQVQISRTQYHDYEGQNQDEIDKLMCLRFVDERDKDFKPEGIIPEGRGIDLLENVYVEKRRDAPKPDNWYLRDEPEKSITDGLVYIDVFGNVIPGCDFSYERQDEEKIGNITEKHLWEIALEHGEME